MLCLVCALLVMILFASNLAAHAVDLTSMQTIGNVAGVNKVEDGIIIDCEDKSQVKLRALAPDLVRVRVTFQKSLPERDPSWAIERTKWDRVSTQISESKDSVTLETSELKVVVERQPLRISFYDRKTGNLINRD